MARDSSASQSCLGYILSWSPWSTKYSKGKCLIKVEIAYELTSGVENRESHSGFMIVLNPLIKAFV